MKIDYVLTAFSTAMFGDKATIHMRTIPNDEARALVSSDTRVMATRVTHERLAKNQFPGVHPETTRYANLRPGVNAIHLHYRGPLIPDDGTLPAGALVTCYLIEVEEYHETE